jgi:hypothetical protein
MSRELNSPGTYRIQVLDKMYWVTLSLPATTSTLSVVDIGTESSLALLSLFLALALYLR